MVEKKANRSKIPNSRRQVHSIHSNLNPYSTTNRRQTPSIEDVTSFAENGSETSNQIGIPLLVGENPQCTYEHLSSMEHLSPSTQIPTLRHNPEHPEDNVSNLQERQSACENTITDEQKSNLASLKDSVSNLKESIPDQEERGSPPKESTSEETFHHLHFGRFSIISISGDGNCMFRSMAHYVFGQQSYHLLVRHMVIHHICNHWDHFKSFAPDEDATTYERRMEVAGVYGSEMEIVAFTDVFRCTVEVFHKSDPGRDPVLRGTEGPPCFFLYSGVVDCGHYDVLEPTQQDLLQDHLLAVEELRRRVSDDFQEAADEVWESSGLTVGEIIKLLTNTALKEEQK